MRSAELFYKTIYNLNFHQNKYFEHKYINILIRLLIKIFHFESVFLENGRL